MLRGPLVTQKKDRIYEFARTHPTGSAFASFLKEMYGYEGFPDEAAGLDYVYSGTDSIELHWTDEHGKKRETKLSWPQAAGIVQRLVDEGRYYANIAIIADLIDRDRYSSFEKIEAAARKKALAFANQKNADALRIFLDDEEMKKAIRAVQGGSRVDPDL